GNLGQDIWVMNDDGKEEIQLTSEAGGNRAPTVSADGRYVVFSSDGAGSYNLWGIDFDGRNPTTMTSGGNQYYPQCSPDGRLVVYTNFRADAWRRGELANLLLFLALQPFNVRQILSPTRGALVANQVISRQHRG